ncbi:MAG: hypothetical protein K6G22_07110 [Lachnospiraceae bacterium]|nr:hypothetical protein [Lachnospiraceae bacterium]
MGFLKNALASWSGSMTFDDPDEGVDYKSLNYNERSEYLKDVNGDDINMYVAYLEGAMKKSKMINGNEWMDSVNNNLLWMFTCNYIRFYDGTLKDCWFFFKYHYRDYRDNPNNVFRLFSKYVRENKSLDQMFSENLLKYFPDLQEQFENRSHSYSEDEDPSYYDNRFGPFTDEELADYYGYESVSDYYADM